MALRSQIGSSLVAKANPASPIRKTEEQKVENPAIPGKGDVGSLNRQFVEQPFLKPIPEGSARTVSVTPEAAAASQSSPTSPLPQGGNVVPGVGNSGQPQPLRSGANSQALFQGGVSTPAAPTAKGGNVARSASVSAPSKGAIGAKTGQITPGAAFTYTPEVVNPFTGLSPSVQQLGGRVSAGEGNNKKLVSQVPATTAQLLGGAAGKLLTNIGTAIKAPQLTPGGLGAKLQTFGGASSVAQQGIGSASNALRSVVQAVSNSLNKLRSLFKK